MNHPCSRLPFFLHWIFSVHRCVSSIGTTRSLSCRVSWRKTCGFHQITNLQYWLITLVDFITGAVFILRNTLQQWQSPTERWTSQNMKIKWYQPCSVAGFPWKHPVRAWPCYGIPWKPRSGFAILMGYFHTPYVGDNYDHFPESPLYRWVGVSVHPDSGTSPGVFRA